MSARVLIVEDEILIAVETEATIADLGLVPVGIAATSAEARRIAELEKPDIALVDVNLADGPTGPRLGLDLARQGIQVVFITANPRMVEEYRDDVVGVMEKPLDEQELAELLFYVTSTARGMQGTPPQALRRG